MRRGFLFVIFVLLSWIGLGSCSGFHSDKAESLYRQGLKMEEYHAPDSAVILYHKALKQLGKSENAELEGLIYNRLGDLLLDHNIYETAWNSYYQALKVSQNLPDKSNLSHAYRGMGKYHYLYKDPDSALFYFEKPLAFFDQIADREERSSVYNNLSSAYKQQNNLARALQCNAKALSLTRNKVKRLRNYAVRGQLFALQMQYDSALFYLEQAGRSDDMSVKASAYFKLADLPDEAGIADSLRYRYLQEAYRLSDSIENMAVAHQIDRQEHIRITTDLKEQSHTRLMIAITICVIALLLISVAVFMFYRRHLKRRNEQLFAHKWEKQEARAQENESRELQMIEIIRKAGERCSRDFKASSTYNEWYKRITRGKESLSYDEQKQFQEIVVKEFDPYLQQLSSVVPLTGNDAFLCALIQLGFSTRECAACRGISNETIRSQRTRLRKKIPQNFSKQGLGTVILGE
ncbi:hypothetical protein QUW50_05275 [Barnesiella viscericola]|uniref:tetratricopeptide repeat protein n=1 Tax=Barnesiella viscericola TaxID=397865 RepID=UPI0025A32F95|nr:hypothetical protein [Barnesiella viscericola]MDM8268450.1 hypothetical protein [Barnesiella viscericola]